VEILIKTSKTNHDYRFSNSPEAFRISEGTSFRNDPLRDHTLQMYEKKYGFTGTAIAH